MLKSNFIWWILVDKSFLARSKFSTNVFPECIEVLIQIDIFRKNTIKCQETVGSTWWPLEWLSSCSQSPCCQGLVGECGGDVNTFIKHMSYLGWVCLQTMTFMNASGYL